MLRPCKTFYGLSYKVSNSHLRVFDDGMVNRYSLIQKGTDIANFKYVDPKPIMLPSSKQKGSHSMIKAWHAVTCYFPFC